MAAVWGGSGLAKGLTTLSPASGAISHISRLSARAARRSSVSGSETAATGVLCFKGGTGSAATVHTRRKTKSENQVTEGTASEVQSCLELHWFLAQPVVELKIPESQSYLQISLKLEILYSSFFSPNWEEKQVYFSFSSKKRVIRSHLVQFLLFKAYNPCSNKILSRNSICTVVPPCLQF